MTIHPPLIIAHRGESYDAPENTLASVHLAWERGADAVEIDVRLSIDGEVVVFHDENTGRLGGRNKKVADTTLKELKTLDVGIHKGKAWAGQKIPAFDEILETVPEGKRLFVEIKCGPEVIPRFKALLRSHQACMNRVIFIGLDLGTLASVKKAFPNHPALWVVNMGEAKQIRAWPHRTDQLIGKAKKARMDGLDVSPGQRVTEAFIRKVKCAKMSLYVWTVNNPKEAARLCRAGIDGITTDRAQWLKEHLNKEEPQAINGGR